MVNQLTEEELIQKAKIEADLASFDPSWEAKGRRFMRLLPSDPRCATCLAPFEGPGAALVKALMNKRPSTMNPLMCNTCEDAIRKLRFGLEVEMSMLFADIRGSTTLAETMEPMEFRNLIDRFYTETTHVLMHSMAMIDKLAGDEVSGYYVPGMAGMDYAKRAVKAAQDLLRVTGHSDLQGPWAPVGVGVHTGVAYFGAVGASDEMVELTALGDAVNVAARLGSEAATGEVIISDETAIKAAVDTSGLERRTVELKGKSAPMDVWVIGAR